MGVIAGKFDVDLDVLLEYNALTDPNALSVGQIIYIPVTPRRLRKSPRRAGQPPRRAPFHLAAPRRRRGSKSPA